MEDVNTVLRFLALLDKEIEPRFTDCVADNYYFFAIQSRSKIRFTAMNATEVSKKTRRLFSQINLMKVKILSPKDFAVTFCFSLTVWGAIVLYPLLYVSHCFYLPVWSSRFMV